MNEKQFKKWTEGLIKVAGNLNSAQMEDKKMKTRTECAISEVLGYINSAEHLLDLVEDGE